MSKEIAQTVGGKKIAWLIAIVAAWVGDEHLVDVHIGHIRRKLDDDPARPRYIAPCAGSATGWARAE